MQEKRKNEIVLTEDDNEFKKNLEESNKIEQEFSFFMEPHSEEEILQTINHLLDYFHNITFEFDPNIIRGLLNLYTLPDLIPQIFISATDLLSHLIKINSENIFKVLHPDEIFSFIQSYIPNFNSLRLVGIMAFFNHEFGRSLFETNFFSNLFSIFNDLIQDTTLLSQQFPDDSLLPEKLKTLCQIIQFIYSFNQYSQSDPFDSIVINSKQLQPFLDSIIELCFSQINFTVLNYCYHTISFFGLNSVSIGVQFLSHPKFSSYQTFILSLISSNKIEIVNNFINVIFRIFENKEKRPPTKIQTESYTISQEYPPGSAIHFALSNEIKENLLNFCIEIFNQYLSLSNENTLNNEMLSVLLKCIGLILNSADLPNEIIESLSTFLFSILKEQEIINNYSFSLKIGAAECLCQIVSSFNLEKMNLFLASFSEHFKTFLIDYCEILRANIPIVFLSALINIVRRAEEGDFIDLIKQLLSDDEIMTTLDEMSEHFYEAQTILGSISD